MTRYTGSLKLRFLLVGMLAALGLVGSAAADNAAVSHDVPSRKGPEAYLLQARRLYPTGNWRDLTNTLVDVFLDRGATTADRPVPQGRIRWHHVPGMRNVRDIGGWNGLPTGRVFRGSEPDCLPVEQVGEKRFHRLGVTEAGLRTMREELRIRTDLDLRAASECPHPDVSALGVRLVRVPLGAYLGAFTATNQYAQALRVFAARGNYPIYFHCWGGADRTGTLAYLVEGLCGVSEADLSIDYELTSFARVFGLRRRTGTPPEYAFPAFVARLKSYPGGTMAEKIAAYMEKTLGLTKAEIAAIRNNVMGEGTCVPAVRETVVRLEELDVHAFTEPTWETRPRAKRSVRDTPLTVGGITYENGVGLLVKDTILGDFFPGGKCRRFEVAFGLDARAHRDARAVLNVWGDERLLATSGEVAPGEAAREMKVDLAGVKVVRIEVTDAGMPNDGVCADLCEAKFVMEDGAEMLESPASFSPQLGILTPTPDGRPRINGPSLYGVRPGKVLLYRVPVSGEKPFSVTVEGLPEGTWFDAATSMLRGTTPRRKGDYPLTVTAKNAKGVARRHFTLVVGNRIGLTPPMGWNSWNCFAPNVSDAHVRAQAEAMFRLGLVEHGWQYLVIDDYWERNEEKGRKPGFEHLAGPVRDADGNILLNTRFPDMKALADHVHALGLKIGIYSSPGPKTCGRCEGSWMHEWRDARQYAAWGFDYLKYDFCSGGTVRFGREPMNRLYPWLMMGKALREQDRDIYYSLSGGGQGYAEQVYANSWRLTSDVFNSWPHIRRSMDAERVNWMYTRPGAWGDPDMLVLQTIGPKRGHRLTPNEQYTHISMWCLFAAPLMIGNDMTKMSDFTRALLTNDEVLDVNQDPLGLCAACVQRPNGGRDEVWAKPMADGSIAAGILNLSYEPRRVRMCFKRLGMRGTWRVRDLWRQREEGLFENGYEVEIPGHATQLVRIWPAEGGHFDGDVQDIRDFAWMNEIAAYRPLKPQDGDCAGCGERQAQARHVSEDNSEAMAATVEAEGRNDRVVSAMDDLASARIWASAKNGKTPFTLTPLVGETDWTEGKTAYCQAGTSDVWNETAFTLTAKGDGRFFVGLSAPHNVRRLYPEIAWTDISIEGAGRQENLDFAHGLSFWGVNTKDAPRIETVDGRRALVVRADRGRYRALDLKAGDTVTVRAKFRVLGPSAAPAGQVPLDVSPFVNAPVPEGVALPYTKRDFIDIYVRTPDPTAHGGNQCVRFRNHAIQPGPAAVTLLDGRTEPCRYLYLLLSSSYTKGPTLATVAVTYTDGTTDTLAITKDRELADWSRVLNGDACQTVFSANGENGTRHFMLARVVLDERKAPVKIALATAENGNLFLYGATLTSADWKPVRAENVTFRLGGEWRLPDMPGRDIVAGSALDLSDQLDFAPCGTYGKVVQKGGHLYFERRPDRPLRFFGNHSSSQWVCDWEPDADRYCEQMRLVGCNAIRLSIHRLDCDWWEERADCHRKHPHSDGFFRDDRIDNFLRFVAAFNRHGIYFLMGSGGGPQEIEAMMAGDAEALEHYRQFTLRLLTKRNPYTGNLVKDEPCLLGWEFANEQSVQHVQHIVAEVPNPDAPLSGYHPVQTKYAARVRALVKPRWEAFLRKKYGGDWARHAAYPKRYTEKTQNALDFQIFSQELMEEQIRFYRDVMKEIGWDKPTMWGNYDKVLRTTETRAKTGMATEVNNYHSFLADDGHGPQVSSVADGMAAFRDIAGAAIPSQPVVVTEYNDCQHNRSCHEMGLAVGAIASLQGWDAFFLHNSTVLTDGLSAPPSFDMNDGLVIANHFSMRASTFLAACLYGRGDVAASPHTVALDYTKAFMDTLSATSYPDPQQLRAVMLCGLRVDWPEYGATPDFRADLTFPGFGNDTAGTYAFLLAQAGDSKSRAAVLEAMVGAMRKKGILGPGNRTDVKRGMYESDTGEILIESSQPRMRIVTRRSEAVTLPANGAYRADCLEIVRTRHNATFGAVAVDGRPLVESGRIVVVMDGESGIDGAVKTPDLVRFVGYRTKEGRARMQGRKIGRANVAKVRLRTARRDRFVLYPLSVNGIRRAPVPVVREGDALVFTLDTNEAALPDGLTPFFELVVEDGH